MSEAKVAYTVTAQPSPAYEDVRFPDGSLAFRIDRQRLIVEIQRRSEKHYFDLASICTESIDKDP